MGSRCKVTFYDVEHRMRRSVEVQAPSPMAAAEAALLRLEERHLLATDFGESVKVEVITTVDHSLSLAAIVQRIKASRTAEIQSTVALKL
jgi:hypothetical protein